MAESASNVVRPRALVLGRTGLIGHSIEKALSHCATLHPHRPLQWGEPDVLKPALQDLICSLLDATALDGIPWAIYWAAGAGRVASSDEIHRGDTASFEIFLDALRHAIPSVAGRTPGAVGFVSSAGALWAGAESWPASELTPVAVTHRYGAANLERELLLAELITEHDSLSAVALRISNAFGDLRPNPIPRGLIDHLATNSMNGTATQIFVPMETIRDYIHTTDAAVLSIHAVDDVLQRPGVFDVRIVASGEPLSINALISTMEASFGREVPINVAPSELADRQPLRLEFESAHPIPASLRPRPLAEHLSTWSN